MDLQSARILLRGKSYDNAAYHAQQCAEKALKGVLVLRGVFDGRRQFTHNIARIIADVHPLSASLARACTDASELTDYESGTRYPGALTVTRQDAREAIVVAEDVYAKVKAYVAGYGANWP